MNSSGEFGAIDTQEQKEREDSPEFDLESVLNDETSLSLLEERSIQFFRKMYYLFYKSQEVRIAKKELPGQIFMFLPNFYQPLLEQIDPYKLGQKKRKLDISSQYAQRILQNYSPIKEDAHTINELVDYLSTKCPEHGYVIDIEMIKQFLPNAKNSNEIENKDYESKLTDLSLYFAKAGFEGKSDSYVGFIPDINNLSKEKDKQVESQDFSAQVDSNITKIKN